MRNANNRRQKSRRTKHRGASAVEFAMVAPFLFLLLFGMMEFGRAMMTQHVLTMAAREGARESVLLGASTTSVQNVISSYMEHSTKLNGVVPTVTVSADVAAANPGDMLTTTITMPFSAVSLWGQDWFGESYQLSGNATMRKEGFQ